MKQQFFKVDAHLETRRLAEKILKKTNYAGRAYGELSMISKETFRIELSYWYNKRFKNRTITPPIELIKKLDYLVRQNKEAKEELRMFCQENKQNRLDALQTSERASGIKTKAPNSVPITIQEETSDSEEEIPPQNGYYNKTINTLSLHLPLNSKQYANDNLDTTQRCCLSEKLFHWFACLCGYCACCSTCLDCDKPAKPQAVFEDQEEDKSTPIFKV